MEKIKTFFNSNKARVAVIIIALLAAVICCVLGEQYISKNNQGEKIAQSTENYSVATQEKVVADTEVQSGTVTVHYVNENGEKLIEDTVKTGNVGDIYEVERPTISMYVSADEEPLTKAGKYEIGNTDVTFKYKKAVSEVLKKVEKEGEDGATENQINIAFNNTKSKQEYGLKIITKDDNGNVINGGEFKISKDGSLLRTGKVRNGDFYAGIISVSKAGKLTYDIEQTKATIGHEKLASIINLGINVTWNEEAKKFEIVLDQDFPAGVSASIKVNENSRDEIIVEVINKKYENMYEAELINKSATELLKGGKFKVVKENETVVEDYTSNGTLYIGSFKISEEGKETYKVYELETAEGYNPVLKDGEAGVVEVTKKFNESKNIYEISVKYSSIEGFSAVVDNSGKVTIYVVNKKQEKDFDLSVKKFVSKIDDKETLEREPSVEIVEEEKDGVKTKEIKYTQDNDMEKVANEQKLEYTVRVYNESKNDGVGQRIVELVPDGLVYLQENETNKEFGWKTYKQDKDGDLIETDVEEEITALATDYLTEKEIKGFNIEEDELPNFEDVKIVFEVKESKITSEDRIVENTVKINGGNKTTNGGEEINEENNIATEKVYVKYFDLDVVKFIKEVTVTNDIKETTQQIGESQKGKLVKIDVAKNQVEKTTIRVTYGLRVKNIGEIEGYATELVDYIPEDFKLIEDGVWKVNGDKAVTTKLQNTLLKPGESTVIEITFEWKLTEDNIGRRINEGKITKYENPYNAKDPTEDNNDKEEMLVQVRTGSTWVFVVIAVLVGLWVVLGIVYVVKKAKEND